MTRKQRWTFLLAVFLGSFLIGATAPRVDAAKPIPASASVSIDNPTPAYGDFITLTADASVTPTYIGLTCSQDGAIVGVSSSPYDYTGDSYSDDVGLYSPIWSGGAASCTATVYEVRFGPHGGTQKRTAIASLSFEVAA